MATDVTVQVDAVSLYEKETARLRGEVGHATREKQAAIVEKDRALHDVTQLQQEKDRLIEENEAIKADMQRIKDSLAEHRKNVEASLAKQEAAARVSIDQAEALQQELKEQTQALHQLKSQLAGVKSTLADSVSTVLPPLEAAIAKLQNDLNAIPL